MRALTSPMHRSLLVCASFALFVSACGGAAYDQKEAEPPHGGSLGYATSPAPTGTPIAAEPEAPSFMRVGEVANAPVPPAAPIVTAAASSTAPAGGSPVKTGTKNSQTDANQRPAEKKPEPDVRGTGEHHTDEEASLALTKPKGGVHGAVVDSASGLTEAEVRSTIVSRQSSFRECYDLGGANFTGSVSLRVSIGPTGTVASVDVLTSTTKSAPVDSCVSGAVRRLQFPAKGAGAVVAFPIEFGR